MYTRILGSIENAMREHKLPKSLNDREIQKNVEVTVKLDPVRVDEEAIEVKTNASLYAVGRDLSASGMAYLLDNFLNYGFNEAKGIQVGLLLRTTHRTLQRLAVVFALGLLYGISKQEYTDARNETAINTAKKVAEMMDSGELSSGLYI